MSASGSGRYGSGAGVPVGDAVPVQETSALIAWREAVQSARDMLLCAPRLVERGSEARLGVVLAGLRDLESQIDGHLAPPPTGAEPPAASL